MSQRTAISSVNATGPTAEDLMALIYAAEDPRIAARQLLTALNRLFPEDTTATCTVIPGCTTDHSKASLPGFPDTQFDHHAPERTVHGPSDEPVFSTRVTQWSNDDRNQPVIEGWSHGTDLEMTTATDARAFAAHLRQFADQVDQDAAVLASFEAEQAGR